MKNREQRYRAAGFEVRRASRAYVRRMAHYLIDHVHDTTGWSGTVFPIVGLIEYWGSECGEVAGKDYPNFEVCEPYELPHGDAEFRAHTNTIVVDREVWDAAHSHDAEARGVLAHEVGHVMLKHFAAAGLYSDTLRVVDPETDSEHQANWFADELLMDSRIIEPNDGVAALMANFHVSSDMATRRIRDLIRERRT